MITWHWQTRCPHCGSSHMTFQYGVPQDRLGLVTCSCGIYACQQCRFVWLNPTPTGDLSSLYPTNYLNADKTESTVSRWYRQDQYRFDFSTWEQVSGKVLSPQLSYLDIGAGSGERVSFVSAHGVIRAEGVDKYDQQSIYSKAVIHNRDVETFFPKKKYDLVSVFHVLEHVSQPQKMMAHIAQHLLVDGGEVILQVPNYGSLERTIFGSRWHGLDVPRHLWHFTAQTLSELLEDEGFQILAVKQQNAFLHPVTTVASLWPSFDVQRLWVESAEINRMEYLFRYFGWIVGTLLSIPWSFLLSVFSQGSMLTLVARKK